MLLLWLKSNRLEYPSEAVAKRVQRACETREFAFVACAHPYSLEKLVSPVSSFDAPHHRGSARVSSLGRCPKRCVDNAANTGSYFTHELNVLVTIVWCVTAARMSQHAEGCTVLLPNTAIGRSKE